ncbi:hypothetical protein KC678_01590 [Candidatus Dojkabacteria bacterium]|uniref:Uncharacterized protein n=1 Tax=Candidatus Dojkabacteria bacterium TaxID=2099670 RepID=A0A955IAL9_9BACT|nr:hypothetical protein [Candidatus Dojkabacteria bacterium]
MENIKEFILASSLNGIRGSILHKIAQGNVHDVITLDESLKRLKDIFLRNEESLRLDPENIEEGNPDFVNGLAGIRSEMLPKLSQEEA